MKLSKNSKARLLWLLLAATLSWNNGWASVVKRLDIQVVLQRDGSARIEERWDIDVDDSDAKTEWYVAHRGLTGGMYIEQLQMEGYVPGHEGLQRYETLEAWDIDASRKEKAGRCGLHNGGQEVCWGFGDYGRHEYVVRYVLRGLVKAYDTCDGFNHCFVDMDCEIESAQVVIRGDDGINLSEANSRRWAFGYEGRFEFKDDGTLVATPDDDLDDDRIILMLETDKGIYQPEVTASEPWADRKQRALEGSDFPDDDLTFGDWVLISVLIIVCTVGFFMFSYVVYLFYAFLLVVFNVAWWVLTLSPFRTKRRRRKLGIAEGNYWRDVDPEWTLVKNKMVMDELSYTWGMSSRHIVGAVLLRLMARGDVSIVRQEHNNKMCDMLRIDHPLKTLDKQQKGDEQLAQRLLKILTQASGDDLILQPKEFKTWCKQKSKEGQINAFMRLLETKEDNKYIEKHAAHLFGLRDFLKDFTLLNERGMKEVTLWDEYMVYAEFFDLTEEVKKQMEQLWPEYAQLSKLTKSLSIAQEANIVYMFSDSIYSSTNSVAARTASHSSGGGFSSYSSSGGGGGYSGGGGGGGR